MGKFAFEDNNNDIKLTKKQIDVLKELSNGTKKPEAALKIHRSTFNGHLESLCKKMQVENWQQALTKAVKLDII